MSEAPAIPAGCFALDVQRPLTAGTSRFGPFADVESACDYGELAAARWVVLDHSGAVVASGCGKRRLS